MNYVSFGNRLLLLGLVATSGLVVELHVTLLAAGSGLGAEPEHDGAGLLGVGLGLLGMGLLGVRLLGMGLGLLAVGLLGVLLAQGRGGSSGSGGLLEAGTESGPRLKDALGSEFQGDVHEVLSDTSGLVGHVTGESDHVLGAL